MHGLRRIPSLGSITLIDQILCLSERSVGYCRLKGYLGKVRLQGEQFGRVRLRTIDYMVESPKKGEHAANSFCAGSLIAPILLSDKTSHDKC
jgi:hypothetical protein